MYYLPSPRRCSLTGHTATDDAHPEMEQGLEPASERVVGLMTVSEQEGKARSYHTHGVNTDGCKRD